MKGILTFLTLLLLGTNVIGQGKISGSLNNAMSICTPDSILWSWGGDHIGHNGSTYLNPYPVWADSTGGQLQKAVSISTYYTHAIVALDDGTVWTWGQNAHGQLGDSLLNTNTDYPVQMRGEYGNGYLDSIVEVSCGYYHSLILKSDSTVWSCGYNLYGQLGVNSTQSWSYPVQVLGQGGVGFLTDIIQVDAGSHSSFALRNDGTVWAWGTGAQGTQGTGSGNNFFPTQVFGLPQITKISIKGGHVLALDINGEIWSWGQNTYGQVGNNTFTNQNFPVKVLDQSGVNDIDSIIDIGTGMMHSFAIHTDGTAYSWGANNYGQLGDGTSIDRYYPVKIHGPNGNGLLNNIVELEGGNLLSVARKSDGTIYCWGDKYTAYPEIINGVCGTPSLDVVNNFTINDIILYPNPLLNTHDANIISKGDNKINSINLLSVTGKVMMSYENLSLKHFKMNVSKLSAGVYFVIIRSESKSITKRLIVQ